MLWLVKAPGAGAETLSARTLPSLRLGSRPRGTLITVGWQVDRHSLPGLLTFMLNSWSLTNQHLPKQSAGKQRIKQFAVLSSLASLTISLRVSVWPSCSFPSYSSPLPMTQPVPRSTMGPATCVPWHHSHMPFTNDLPATSVHLCRMQSLHPPGLLRYPRISRWYPKTQPPLHRALTDKVLKFWNSFRKTSFNSLLAATSLPQRNRFYHWNEKK